MSVSHKAFSGVLWSALDKFGSQIVSFVVSLILARLLTPDDFGVIAMSMAFFSIAKVVVDSGMKDSLIQKKNADHSDFNTVFYFNIGIACVLYLIVFFTSPYLSLYFNQPELETAIRFIGLVLIVDAFSIVQNAILTKQLAFKRLVKVRLPAVAISGILGIAWAYFYPSYWALVIQVLTESIFYCIFLWISSAWKPGREFNFNLVKFHWEFGYKLLFSSIIASLYKNVYSFVIGKQFGVVSLAYYNRAESFRVLISNNTINLVQSVTYPIMASIDDVEEQKKFYRNILTTTLLGITPVFVLLFGLAGSIVFVLFGDKWMEVVPMLEIIAWSILLYPFNSINLNILKVKRKTGLFLKLEAIKKGILILLIVITLPFGLYYVVLTNVIISVIALFLNNYFSSSLINYSLAEQIKDCIYILISGIVMFVALYLIKMLNPELGFFQLVVCSVVSVIAYALMCILLMPQKIKSLVNLVRKKIL